MRFVITPLVVLFALTACSQRDKADGIEGLRRAAEQGHAEAQAALKALGKAD